MGQIHPGPMAGRTVLVTGGTGGIGKATALGLATHQMAGFDHDAARKVLEIPENYVIGSVIALGYQAEPAALANQQLIDRELAPRERKPLKEIAFSSWDIPADLS